MQLAKQISLHNAFDHSHTGPKPPNGKRTTITIEDNDIYPRDEAGVVPLGTSVDTAIMIEDDADAFIDDDDDQRSDVNDSGDDFTYDAEDHTNHDSGDEELSEPTQIKRRHSHTRTSASSAHKVNYNTDDEQHETNRTKRRRYNTRSTASSTQGARDDSHEPTMQSQGNPHIAQNSQSITGSIHGLSMQSLYNPYVSAETIVAEVIQLIPRLDPNTWPDIQSFNNDLSQRQPQILSPIPEFVQHIPNGKWRFSDDAIKQIFLKYLAEEAKLDLGRLPDGLDMDEKYAVAPIGSLDDLTFVFTAWPNATRFSSKGYSSINDLSCPTILTLYTKLKQVEAGERLGSMLHLDVFSRQLIRAKLNPSGGKSVLNQIPRKLRKLWSDYAKEILHQSHSRIGLLFGGRAVATYVEYLDDHRSDLEYEVIRPNTNKDAYPYVWLEFKKNLDGTRGCLHRLVFVVCHPEVYNHIAGRQVAEPNTKGLKKKGLKKISTSKLITQYGALRERFIDFAHVLLHGQPIRPGYLSSRNYFHFRPVHILIPVHVLYNLDETNRHVFESYLTPAGYRCREALENFINSNSVLTAKKKFILGTYSKWYTRLQESVSGRGRGKWTLKDKLVPMIQQYYKSEDVRAVLGVYADFYIVQAVDRVLNHATRRAEGWQRYSADVEI